MENYRYGVTFTILTTVESDEPLEFEDIIEIAAKEFDIDPSICNDIVVNIF